MNQSLASLYKDPTLAKELHSDIREHDCTLQSEFIQFHDTVIFSTLMAQICELGFLFFSFLIACRGTGESRVRGHQRAHDHLVL